MKENESTDAKLDRIVLDEIAMHDRSKNFTKEPKGSLLKLSRIKLKGAPKHKQHF